MYTCRLVLIPAVALGAVFVAALTGCTLYGAGDYRGFGQGRSASSYGPMSGGNSCGYASFSRCSDLGAYRYGYNHLHSGWEDGFHGHFGSSHDNPWFSRAFGFDTYGRHDSQAHDALGIFAPPMFNSWRMDHGKWGHWTSTAVWDESHGLFTRGTSHREIAGHVSSGHPRAAPHSSQSLRNTPSHRFGSGLHVGSHH